MTFFGINAFLVGQTALLAVLLVALFPWRRQSVFKVNKTLAADPATVWQALASPSGGMSSEAGVHPAMPPMLKSMRADPADPRFVEATYEIAGRRTTTRFETLESDPPRRQASKLVAIDGHAPPLGRSFTSESDYVAVPGGTEVRSVVTHETANLLHYWLVSRRLPHMYDRAEEYFRTGSVKPRNTALRARLTTIVLSLSGLASFYLLFAAQGDWMVGLYAALGFAAILLLHEFGHWLAMRIVGQTAPRFMLVPFFGGIAIPSAPYKAAIEGAFVTLMGPGFSAMAVGVLLITVHLATGTASSARVVFSEHASLAALAPQIGHAAADFIAALNLLQLLPVLPLDGGRLLHVLSGAHTSKIARALMGGLSLAALALAVWLRDPAIGLLSLIGALGLRAQPAGGRPVRPLSAFELTAVLAGLAATLVLLGLPLTQPGSFSRFGLNAAWAAFNPSTGLADAPGAKGSRTVEPKFGDTADLLAGLDSWHWVTGGTEVRDRSEWRMWGTPDEAGPYAQINVVDVSHDPGTPKSFADLREFLKDNLESMALDATFSGDGRQLDTSLGPFGVVGFSSSNTVGLKDCLGFHGFAGGGAAYIAGHYCAALGAKASLAHIRELIEGLRFGDA